MDIDNPVLVFLYHLFRQNHQKACQNHQIRLDTVQFFQKRLIELPAAFKLLRGNAGCFNPMVPGTFQRIGSRIVADNGFYPCVGYAALGNSVDNCL